MIEEIKTLTVQGGFFEKETSLDLFENEKDRISILYGRNGSGKSTISKAFREYNNSKNENSQELNTFEKIELKNFNKEILNFVNYETQDCIHVFDDYYILNNIKLVNAGLKSIVMFGKNVNLDSQIQDIIESKKNIEDKLLCKKETNSKYSDEKSTDNPEFYDKKMNKTLKSDNGWAERDRRIKSNKNKSNVKPEFIKELGEKKVSSKKNELIKDFENTLKKYNKINNDNNIIKTTIEMITLPYNDTDITTILEKKIDEPKATEREKKILLTIQGPHPNRVSEFKEVCSNNENTFCPFCYQPISKEYKENLLVEINYILNEDVEIHKTELEDIYFPDINLDLDIFKIVDNVLVEKINEYVEIYRERIRNYMLFIATKKANVFTPVFIDKENSIKLIVDNLNKKINELNTKIVEFNNNIKDKNLIKEKLIELNSKIAHLEIIDDYKMYTKKTQEKNKSEKEIAMFEESLKDYKETESKLNSEKENIVIAVENINKSLNYIFFGKDRMSVEVLNGQYYVKTYGKNVSLRNISVGECNILALCYFFSKLSENSNQGEEYSKPMLVLLDDPISSFDLENKIGIQSFLRAQVNKILLGNEKSKIIIQSHEISTIYDFEKASSDILSNIQSGKSNNSVRVSELSNKEILKFNIYKRHEYSKLFNDIYDFACKSPDYEKNEMIIGNEMRRLLEAYSTFVYKSGMAQLSTDKKILEKLGNKDLESYFENLMYRLVLHGESHTLDKIKSLNFENFISISEKVKTARDIIVFLYILNSYHVLKHLNNNKNIESKILGWKNNILSK